MVRLGWLVAPAVPTAADEALLDPAERARAARLLAPEARATFVAAHAAVRRLLAETTGTAPDTLRFAAGPHGKPRLDPPCGVAFNLSHSGRVVVIATAGLEVLGVDVERLTLDRPHARLAARFFAEAEAAAVAAAPAGPRRRRLFCHLWTAKEAVLKALGTGLTVPLREVVVDPDPDRPPRLVATPAAVAAADRWRLLRVEQDDWLATVAVLHREVRLEVTGLGPAPGE